MTVQKLSDGTYRVKDAAESVPDIKAKYKADLKSQYGASVVIKQSGKRVKIYFSTKRIAGSMTFGPTDYRNEESFKKAKRLYSILTGRLKASATPLKEGHFPSGVAAWEGEFVLK